MQKHLTQLAAFSLALVPALTASHAGAGLVVNNPSDYKTSIVDPLLNAEDIDGTVGPTYDRAGWNAQPKIYTLNFDQTGSFTNGQQLDKVNLTALGQSVTFSSNGYTTGQGFKVDNTAIHCTSAAQSITTMTSLVPGVDSNPSATACDILTIGFSTPVTGVAFTSMFEWGGIQVAYYDASHNLLYWANRNSSGEDTTTSGTWMDYFFTFQGNISSIEIKRLYDTGGFSIDDLSFTQVPEPAGLALLGLGALAVGRRRRG